jgi:MFS family permease
VTNASSTAPPKHVAFAALRHPTFRVYFATVTLAMMADNIEHVLTYWVLFQTFRYPALMGYAVISHWAPFLLGSVFFGMLADHYDCRRIIQASQLLFAGVSLCWSLLFFTGSLEVWHAVVLLAVHGLAGVIFSPANQVIIHDMVGPDVLPSAVRLNATARSLGILLGPGLGGLLLLLLGPPLGLVINAGFYLAIVVWLLTVPYTGHSRADASGPRPRVGLNNALGVFRAVAGQRAIVAVIATAGLAALLVGNAFQAQMPEFAEDLGTGDASLAYSILLGADAAGAVLGGVLLEVVRVRRPSAPMAVLLAGLWAATLLGFAATTSYPLALGLLFLSGVFLLAFNTTAQTIVQLEAPGPIRGSVIGLFNMAQQGLRIGSGVTVGVLGSVLGVHWSLGLSAAGLLLLTLGLLIHLRYPRRGGTAAGLGAA